MITTGAAEETRHPLDPDVCTSSRAAAVLLLGVVAVLMMFCVGGVVPAALGLALSRGASAELASARGFLSGDGMLRTGVVMCWVALGTGLFLIFLAVVGALIWAGTGEPPQFGSDVD